MPILLLSESDPPIELAQEVKTSEARGLRRESYGYVNVYTSSHWPNLLYFKSWSDSANASTTSIYFALGLHICGLPFIKSTD